MNSFRVTLFLQHFFSDQRASCRVYITSRMKTIQDLQTHINDIFHLDKDFYLISNNLYLPNAEDVRVLKEDDIVIAVPCNLTQLQPCNGRTEPGEIAEPKKALKSSGIKRKRSTSVTNDNDSKKKKNRKKSELENNYYVNAQIVDVEKKENNEEDKLVIDNYSKKKKKCKKSKSEDNDRILENVDIEFPNNYGNKKKKKKNKEKVDKSLSNDKDHVKNLHNEDNDKKEEITVYNSFTNTVKVGNTRSDLKENNNNLSKTIPSSTPLRLSKPKKLELMRISSIPKVIKTIHVYDREPIANNKIVDELSRCKECENEAMAPTANNTDEGSKVTKLINDDDLVEYPEKVSVNNRFITFSFVNNSDNTDPNPYSTTTNSINDKKTNEITEDEKCEENMNKSIISNLDSNRVKSINDSEVPLLNDEKYELFPEKTNSTNDAEIISTMNNEDQLKEITENKKVHVLDNVCVQPAVADKDSTRNSVISTEEFSESIASITTDEVSLELFKPKRKRKRTRRKKVKQPVENGVFETPPIFNKPDSIPTPSNKHIKFEDDNEDGILKDQHAQQFQSNIDNTVYDQNNQQDVEENVNIVQVIENASSPFSYEKLCKEEIMKYPVMVDIYPKIGDIIAFKIYILSEHYTPEISNFIIAKVVNYDTENKIVFLRFLVGGEQCTEPEGKFYMETVISQSKSGDRYFSWEALKEPRLLFP